MDLLDDIRKTIEKFHVLEKAKKHISALEKELDANSKELERLEKKLDKEYRSYEKLEEGGIQSMFYNILGNKEKQLEKGRQEYLQLTLEYDQLKSANKLKEYEYDVLKGKLGEYDAVKNKLDELKEQRERILLKSKSKEGNVLRRIMKRQDELIKIKTDIEEAHEVGQQLYTQINIMLRHLEKAHDWGQWDLHNSKHYYKRQQYSSIDRARQASTIVMQLMSRYEREVRDVYPNFEGLSADLSVNENRGGFMNVFFDNLISDWIVQKRIANSANQVKALRDKVLRLKSSLDQERVDVDKDYAELEKERHALLEGRLFDV